MKYSTLLKKLEQAVKTTGNPDPEIWIQIYESRMNPKDDDSDVDEASDVELYFNGKRTDVYITNKDVDYPDKREEVF